MIALPGQVLDVTLVVAETGTQIVDLPLFSRSGHSSKIALESWVVRGDLTLAI